MGYEHVQVLRVRAWGRDVGALAAGRRGHTFEYEPTWVRTGIELAPLLMGTRERTRVFRFPHLDELTFYGLPPMLADAVPDRFGNALINATLAREGVDARDVSALDRLAYVGERAMGALTFHPESHPRIRATAIEMNELVTAARLALQGNLNDDILRTGAMQELIAVGTSAGGAHAKAVLAWNRATGQMRAGNVDVPDGFEQWLLKFDGLDQDGLGASRQDGRVEYAYHLMAVDAGVEMSACELLEEGERAHFITRRFDRPGTGGDRLHAQTLCALAGMDFNQLDTHDYASLFTTMRALGIADTEQALRRVAFNVLAANVDDHTKNIAFLMGADGTWQLAPAYDLTFTHDPAGRYTNRHLMSVNGHFEDVTVADLLVLADRFEVPGARRVIAEVSDAVGRWPEHASRAGVSRARIEQIHARLGAPAR